MNIKTLYVLGFFPERLNILLELANASEGFNSFVILENMAAEHPEHFVDSGKYQVTIKNCYEYPCVLNVNDNYAYGVIGIKSKEHIRTFFDQKNTIPKKQYLNLIHPSAVISSSAQLDFGLQVEPFSCIHVLAKIGFGVIVKSHCYIGHHAEIGDYVTINPGVTVSGFSKIGKNTMLGAGAIIRDGVSIGENTIIGMGSVVTNDIPDNSIAYGSPCKVQRSNS